MSTVQEIENAISRLSTEEMRQVQEWLEQQMEDRLEMTAGFTSRIERSESEMAAGLRPLTRSQPGR